MSEPLSTELLDKCTVCGGLLDEEDLFCPNCGTEAPARAERTDVGVRTSTHNFQCSGCGASMSYDASASALRCPFCGSTRLEKQDDAQAIRPAWVVPFSVGRDEAVAALRGRLKSSFWYPSDLATSATIEKMMPVYVPYWVFQGKTDTHWTADTNRTPPGASGDWYPMTGRHDGNYSGVLIGAGGALTSSETAAIDLFDLSRAVDPETVDLENVTFEQFRVSRKYARPAARSAFEQLERDACDDYVPGTCRNLHVNVLVRQMSSVPVLLPVWIAAYRYRDRLFRFLINGQTGLAAGQAPISFWKPLAFAGLGILLVLIVLMILGLGMR